MGKYLFYNLLFIGFSFSLWAQTNDVTLSQYSVNEGLSQSTVTCLFQDSNGFLWVGTCDGLNRFDGYLFKQFFSSAKDTTSLTNSTIRSVCADKQGNLWIGTECGYNKLDGITGTIHRFYIEDKNKIDPSAKVYFVNNKLFLFSRSMGIGEINPKNGAYKIVASDSVFCSDVRGIDTHDSTLWFSNLNPGRFFRLDTRTMEIRTIQLPQKYRREKVISLFYNKDTLVILTGKALLLYDVQAGLFLFDDSPKSILLSDNQILTGTISPDKNLWLGIKNVGLHCYNPNFQLLTTYDDLFACYGKSFHLRNPTTVYATDGQNVWAGTDGHGLIKITPQLQKFETYNLLKFANYLGVSNIVKAIFVHHDGLLYLGVFQSGLFVTNKARNSGTVYNIQNSKSLPSNNITAIQELNDKSLLIGLDNGIVVFNTEKRQIVRDERFKNVDNMLIYCLSRQKNGNIFIGTNNGLYLFDGTSALPTTLNLSGKITHITAQNDTTFFISEHSKGFYQITGKDSDFRIIQQAPMPSALANSHVNCNSMVLDWRGNLWVATDKDLLEYDSLLTLTSWFGLDSGLPSLYCYSLLIDSAKQLWISTNNGISKFDIQERQFTNYSVSDGLQAPEFNTGSYFQTDNGELFFGGVNGFNSFYPKKMVFNTLKPKIGLSSILLFDKPMNVDSVRCLQSLEFSYKNNTLTFEVCGVELTNPKQNQYAFFMKNLDENWYLTGYKRSVRYASMQPGMYELWVKASNNDGVWSDQKKIVTLHIHPPFWETYWFRILGVLAIILLTGFTIFMIYVRRLKKELARVQHAHEIERVRHGISMDIHDDIGAGISKIAMISELARLDVSEQNFENVHSRVSELAQISTGLIRSLGEIVWIMKPENDNLSSLLAFIRIYANNYFNHSNIDLTIDFPESIPTINVRSEVRRNLILILKEALNNCRKYAEATQITILFELNENQFRLKITDNGKGFNFQTLTNMGNGLKNMKFRANSVGLKSEIHSAPLNGTFVAVSGFIYELSRNPHGEEKNKRGFLKRLFTKKLQGGDAEQLPDKPLQEMVS